MTFVSERSVHTEHVPDGSIASATKSMRAPSGTSTQHVPDLPRFGRYQTVAELGSGAMGTVYRAHDEVLGRAVAIKVLHLQGDAAVRERFLREARAVGATQHPNIIAIYDAGTDGDAPYLVMELASGGSLRERVKAGRVPPDVVQQVGIQVARALAAAHAANILHRDIKPANILAVDGGTWKLADFGIARLPDSTLTITGQFLGSPSYAAPESLRSGEFSAASDVYGLGATLYEALSGQTPHGDHDMRSIIRKLEEEPTPVTSIVAAPGSLGDAIMAALARDPARRPSAEQLAAMLAGIDAPARAVAAAIPSAAPRAARPRWLVVATLAGIALLAVMVVKSRGGSPTTSGAAIPGLTTPVVGADDSADSSADDEPASERPQVFDQYGNPVDDETAREVLDQLERDGQLDGMHRGDRPIKHKKHKRR
jgi:serine/threonine protein kinase